MPENERQILSNATLLRVLAGILFTISASWAGWVTTETISKSNAVVQIYERLKSIDEKLDRLLDAPIQSPRSKVTRSE
jgi:ABC-type anion transport system duplicated permease subunit